MLVFVSSSYAQNIWGVDAGIDQALAEFAEDFTETGIPGSYPEDAWTALSVNDSGGSNIPGSAYWIRSTIGYSQGAYWNGTTPVSSPSQPNGIAIFDSDYMDNNGNTGAFGTGSSPAPHLGELISPRIDLTLLSGQRMAVKFFSFYRNFQISSLSVSVSTDDGFTWGNPIDYRSLLGELTQGIVVVEFPEDELTGVTDLTQSRIKFTFSGDYYFAIIDDVSISVSDLIYESGFEQ